MNKYLTAVLLLVCGGAICAQAPAEKNKAAAGEKTVAAQTSTPAAQPKKAVKAAPAAVAARPAAARPAVQEAEESFVMIDSKADAGEDGYSGPDGAERGERGVPGGLPWSYGQCKGVINEPGRSILVFESQEDGTVFFVQVIVGKSRISWKLIDRIPRSSD